MSARSLMARLRLGASRTVSDEHRRRARPAVGLVIAAAMVVAIALLALALLPAHRAARTPTRSPPPQLRAQTTKPLQAYVTIVARAPAVGVPRSFVGLSTEYWALPIWERRMTVLKRVMSLLRVPGDGPLVMRIGGDSSDEALWEPRMHKVPEWVIELTPAWLREARVLLHRSGARLILDLNLVTASAAEAAEWARAAEAALPRGAIVGFEIGNEPDLYNRGHWAAITSGTGLGSMILPRALSPRDYARDFRSYARALRIAAPRVPLLGPAVAYPARNPNWITTLLAGPHPELRVVTAHEYPSSACAVPGSSGYPTIARLLSETAVATMASALRPVVGMAHHAGLSFRLTELNSLPAAGVPVSATRSRALCGRLRHCLNCSVWALTPSTSTFAPRRSTPRSL